MSKTNSSTAPDALAILKNHSLQDLVQKKLESMILDGRLAPGEQLREYPLALSLGVSRGPVREAFRALKEKGLLCIEKNHGVHVRILTLEEADHIYEVRVCLEAMIGQKTATSIKASGIRELAGLIAKMEQAATIDDVNPYTSLNLAFHDALARLSGNAQLHITYSRLVGQLSLYRRKAYLHDKRSMALSLSEHKAVFEAIRKRNGALAAQLLQAHAEDSRKRLHEAIQG